MSTHRKRRQATSQPHVAEVSCTTVAFKYDCDRLGSKASSYHLHSLFINHARAPQRIELTNNDSKRHRSHDSGEDLSWEMDTKEQGDRESYSTGRGKSILLVGKI